MARVIGRLRVSSSLLIVFVNYGYNSLVLRVVVRFELVELFWSLHGLRSTSPSTLRFLCLLLTFNPLFVI
jgi:hypothetical protein